MATNQESRRARRSAAEWRQVLSRFVGSGLAVEAFCNREGISDTSFYRWRSRLGALLDRGDVAPLTPSPSGHFVDVGPLQSESERPGRLELTLDLGGGLQLHLVRS
ncbi:MAG: IS66 family insertion sequence element accessory protein TnpB [Zoogloeaceae bacterium]|nr:IS66 family insertion sequence element accessory protein TnpB [Zoogloeaceae bacterium]